MIKKAWFLSGIKENKFGTEFAYLSLDAAIFQTPKLLTMSDQLRMKRLVISCILILPLIKQAHAMAWLGGGKGGMVAALREATKAALPI